MQPLNNSNNKNLLLLISLHTKFVYLSWIWTNTTTNATKKKQQENLAVIYFVTYQIRSYAYHQCIKHITITTTIKTKTKKQQQQQLAKC